MPLVKIEIRKGKNKEYKSKLFEIVHQTLVDIVKIPDRDRMQRLYELDKDNFEISPGRTENCTIIEITMFKGRTEETKKKFLHELSLHLKNELHIEDNDLLIVLHEIPIENWGLSGGKPASEVNLGFKINV